METRYRQSRDPGARSQWQRIWLVARGQPTPTVIALTGYSESWISVLVGRYNVRGVAGIGDRRHANPGATPLLATEGQEALRLALAGVSDDGGQWTGPKGAAWRERRLGERLYAQRGGE